MSANLTSDNRRDIKMQNIEALHLFSAPPNISYQIYVSVLPFSNTTRLLPLITKIRGPFRYRDENNSLNRALTSVSISPENVSHSYLFLPPTPIKRTDFSPFFAGKFIHSNVGSDSFQKRTDFPLKQNPNTAKHNLQILRKGIKSNRTIRMLPYKRSYKTTQRYIKKRRKLINVEKKMKYVSTHLPTTFSDKNTEVNGMVNNASTFHPNEGHLFKNEYQSKLHISTSKKMKKYAHRSKERKRVGTGISRSTSKEKSFTLKNTKRPAAKTVKKTTSAWTRLTTPNNTLVRLWRSQIVWVSLLKDNETMKENNKDVYEEAIESNDRKKFALSLTPPIIVSWVYKLARALSEGYF